tara:strand:- start:229 stop:582 length:354 start_codon:yes stop_codon:yes gene_type:complete
MRAMIDKIFGTEKAGFILLYLYHYGEMHPRAIARGMEASVSAVQNQLKKFEDAGVIVSKTVGRSRVYFFNKKNPLTKPLMEMVGIVHSSMSLDDKERLFKQRARPRRAGKPVIGRDQ